MSKYVEKDLQVWYNTIETIGDYMFIEWRVKKMLEKDLQKNELKEKDKLEEDTPCLLYTSSVTFTVKPSICYER